MVGKRRGEERGGIEAEEKSEEERAKEMEQARERTARSVGELERDTEGRRER